ncbi:MAG: choice-of-anchor D domain-containing protein, partial [Candidatus Korobacteraceae bacterium]
KRAAAGAKIFTDASLAKRKCATGLDCSAFVALSWGISGSHPLSVQSIANYAHTKPLSQARPGDAISYQGPYGYHVVLIEQITNINASGHSGRQYTVCQEPQHAKYANCKEILKEGTLGNFKFVEVYEYNHVSEVADSAQNSPPAPPPPAPPLPIPPKVMQVSFGNVEIGTQVYQTVDVGNDSSAAEHLTVTPSIGDSDFSPAKQQLSILPRSAATLTIGFSPTSPGPHRGDVMIENGAKIIASVHLSGTAVSHCLSSPGGLIDLGSIVPSTLAKAPVDFSIEVRNCGTEPIAPTRVDVAALNGWQISYSGSDFTSLAPDSEGTLRFKMSQAGDSDLAGNVVITSTAVTPVVVKVKAQLIKPCLKILQGTSIDLGNITSKAGGVDKSITLLVCGISPVENARWEWQSAEMLFGPVSLPPVMAPDTQQQVNLHLQTTINGAAVSDALLEARAVQPQTITIRANIVGCFRLSVPQISFGIAHFWNRKMTNTARLENCGESVIQVVPHSAEEPFHLPKHQGPYVLGPGTHFDMTITYSHREKGDRQQSIRFTVNGYENAEMMKITASVGKHHWWSIH